MDKWKCVNCKTTKSADSFYDRGDGRKRRVCKVCDNQRAVKWREDNPFKAKATQRASDMRKKTVPVDKKFKKADYWLELYSAPIHCAICNVLCNLTPYHPKSATVDQIIPGAGYIEGNVQMLCFECNRIKADADPYRIALVAEKTQQLWESMGVSCPIQP